MEKKKKKLNLLYFNKSLILQRKQVHLEAPDESGHGSYTLEMSTERAAGKRQYS